MGERIKLLLCDDNDSVRLTLARALRYKKDLEVLGEAASFEELLEMIDTHKPHVVLTDVNLPGLDGVSGLKKLRREGNTIPVIVMSADKRFKGPAEQAGAQAFFYKGSTDLSELVADIRNAAVLG